MVRASEEGEGTPGAVEPVVLMMIMIFYYVRRATCFVLYKATIWHTLKIITLCTKHYY